MSNYRTHNCFNFFIIFPPCLIGAYYYLPKELVITFFISFIIGTLLINPDCDIAHKTYVFSLRGILLYPFRFYSRVFSHRGISHSHIAGTLTRIIWLFVFFLPIILFLFFLYPRVLETFSIFLASHPKELLVVFLALLISDSAHILLDRV